MNRNLGRMAILLGLMVFGSRFVASQVSISGVQPFGSFQQDGFDTVNVGDLNVHFAIPIFARAGRGGFDFSYVMTYDSSVWYPGGGTWLNTQDWGWKGQTQVQTGWVPVHVLPQTCIMVGNKTYLTWYEYTYSRYIDNFGTSHSFPSTTIISLNSQDCASPPTGNYTATVKTSDGYTVYLNGESADVYPPKGGVIVPPVSATTGSGGNYDRNGNEISTDGTTFTDTLDTTALTVSGSGTPSSPITFQYTNYTNAAAPPFKFNYTNYNVATKFACSGISDVSESGIPLVSSISLPDGSSYTITYEGTPGSTTGQVTGRIAKITLPTGGYVTYAYSGPNNGIQCSDGSAAGLTIEVYDNAKGPWQWVYSRSGSGSAWTTTETDPQNDTITVNFQTASNNVYQYYETGRTISNASGTAETIYTCYNGNGSGSTCPSTAVSTPISRRTIYKFVPTSSGDESKTDEFYDSLYNLTERDEYDFGAGTVGGLTRKTTISYDSLTQTISGISSTFEVPGTTKIFNGSGTQYAQTIFTYDDTTLTGTSGLPQHASVSGSRGNLTHVYSYSSSGTSLQQTYAYYDTGMLNTATDPNNNTTTYAYSSTVCYDSFPTSVTEPLSLTRSFAWNCTGGVLTSTTDENGNQMTLTYNDPNYWRPTASTDQNGTQTTISYPISSGVEEGTDTYMSVSGSSIADQRITWDGIGRAHITQRQQAPSTNSYDSAETDYNGLGLPMRQTMPYSAAAGTPSSSVSAVSTTYDPLGRVAQIVDGGGGTLNYTYTENDVLRVLSPHPTGENNKQSQMQYDGLGRLISVCEITSASGSGSCAQTVAATGYLTKYQYDPLNDLTTVTQNAQASPQQTRTYGYDWLGRMISEANPEQKNVATTYNYDSDPTGTCTSVNTNAKGHLAYRKDPNGTVSCYGYDQLGRLTTITYPVLGSGVQSTPSKYYVYDAASLNGTAMSYAKGRLAEAYTGSSTSKTTDLLFSYSPRGDITDTYESTPNSGGYYHLSATYWPHGLLDTLSLPGVPQLTYAVDSEGRVSQVSVPSGQGQNPVSGVTYGDAWQPDAPTKVTFGSGDYDVFTYDLSTGRTTGYQYTIGSTPQTYTGTLQWNTNGTLATLAITDPFDSAEDQNCSYSYDDLARLGDVNCVNGSTNIWNQDFAYGVFGNITKTVPSGGTGTSFEPSYNSYNQITTVGGISAQYDANGNLTFDPTTSISYSWDGDNRPAILNGFGLTADAFGRIVEKNNSGSYIQYVFGPDGRKVAVYKGQTVSRTYIPLPGGAEVNYSSTGISAYAHADWQGSIRLAVTPGRSVIADIPYGPYGEPYSTRTGTYSPEFTHQEVDITAPLNDFTYREYNYIQGRWISPDPARRRCGQCHSADLESVRVRGWQSSERHRSTWICDHKSSMVLGFSKQRWMHNGWC